MYLLRVWLCALQQLQRLFRAHDRLEVLVVVELDVLPDIFDFELVFQGLARFVFEQIVQQREVLALIAVLEDNRIGEGLHVSLVVLVLVCEELEQILADFEHQTEHQTQQIILFSHGLLVYFRLLIQKHNKLLVQ